jgi:hypothetical protein
MRMLELTYKQSTRVAALPFSRRAPPTAAGVESRGTWRREASRSRAVGSSLAFIVTQVKSLTVFDILSGRHHPAHLVMARGPAGVAQAAPAQPRAA